MKERNILITLADYYRLNDIIVFRDLSDFECAEAIALRDELEHAKVIEPDAVPPGVITMNSRAELIDMETGERLILTLSYPGESDSESRVSVLTPLGHRMLGARIGDTIEFPGPVGVLRLKVLDVTFQTELLFASTE